MVRKFTDEVLDDRVAEILREKSPAERLAMTFGMWSFAQQMVRRIVAHEHPDWSAASVERETARRTSHGADFDVTFASPEDAIIKKLQFFREGGSEKHLRDIVGVLKVQKERINRDYLARWIADLGLEAEWQLVEARLNEAAG
jgi:hypothetical protein